MPQIEKNIWGSEGYTWAPNTLNPEALKQEDGDNFVSFTAIHPSPENSAGTP